VLRRQVTGLEVSADGETPRNTGGDMARVSATAGFGTSDGFSAFATLDHRRQQAIQGTDRAFSKSGPLRGPDEYLTSGTSFPGDLDGFEPSLAAGCAPPRSIPSLDGKSCRYDFVGDIDLVPRNEQTTLLSQATLALGPEHQGLFEYLRAENRTLARQTPTPTSMRLPDTSPYWIAGRPSTEFEDGGRGGIANWLIVPAGRRANQTQAVAQRVLVGVEGRVGGFDYQAGLARSTSTVTDALTDGYLSFDRVQQALLDGRINPFGPQSAEGAAAIEAAQLRGRLLQAKGEVSSVDARASTQLMPLDGGALAVSLGVEAGRESFRYDLQPLAAENASEGLEFAVDTRGSRTAAALYTELVAPLTQTFSMSLAARHDRYSDSGDRLSPKLSARWQPQAQLLLRGSVGRGFRAPTLYEVHLPQQLALSGDSYDDPLLCPDGTAVAGASSAVVCDQQVLRRFGGPAGYGEPAGKLRPETSKGLSFGLVFEPSERMTVGIDLWDIRLHNEIDELSEQAIFDQPTRYASRIVRCSQLSAAQRADIGVCLNYPAFDPIAFVDAPIENLGDIKTSGVDLSLALSSGSTPHGQFSFDFESTYVVRYLYRSERGGAYTNNVGRYADDIPIFRWQHVAQASWTAGAWGAALSQRHMSGYTDQEDRNRVGAYSLFDLSVSYTGIRNLTLSAGVKNLFDRQPPYSNQDETLQRNYDPRFTDPVGRAFMSRAMYKFF